MNCSEVRDALPLLLYGDLGADAAAALEGHLAGCPACHQELESLQGVRRLLDAVPAPAADFDLAALRRRVTGWEEGRVRRWRRAALLLGSAAALLLVSFALRLDVRFDSHQAVVRWGNPPAEPVAPVPPATGPVAREARPDADTEERLRTLRELIYALKEDGDGRDQRYQQQLAELQARLQLLQLQADRRWSETEDNVSALYLLTRKGE
jgi:anti-sigma factor RsiW